MCAHGVVVIVRMQAQAEQLTWYTWSVVLFFLTLTVTVVMSGNATRSSTSETPL